MINAHRFTAKHRIPLIEHLLSRGYEIKCLTPENSGAYYILNENNIKTIDWRVSRSGLNIISELYSIYQLYKIYLDQKPVLIVHATIKPVIYGTIASIFSRSGYVVNLITGLGSVFISKKIKSKIINKIISLIYRIIFSIYPQTVIFQNKADKDLLLKHKSYPKLKTKIISGSGIEVSQYPHLELPTIKNITLIGRMIEEKGVLTFINAAKMIIKERSDINFTLVGPLDSGNPSSINKDLIKLWENQKIIKWHGYTDNMLDVYKKSTIICLPSYREGLPKTLLEAGLTGRPVIASDVPGCRDVIISDKTGYLIPLNDHKAIYSYIIKIIDNEKKIKEMGTTGRKYVIKNFSSKVIIPQIVDQLEKNRIERNNNYE